MRDLQQEEVREHRGLQRDRGHPLLERTSPLSRAGPRAEVRPFSSALGRDYTWFDPLPKVVSPVAPDGAFGGRADVPEGSPYRRAGRV